MRRMLSRVSMSCVASRAARERENMKTISAKLFAASLVAALALCTVATPAAAQTPARPTIAVLPLANASGDAAQNFFAEGLTDEIAVMLSGVRGLGVVARSSSFQLKAGNRDSKAIGGMLGASFLVEGTARLAGERV